MVKPFQVYTYLSFNHLWQRGRNPFTNPFGAGSLGAIGE